uniref:CD48 antigen n=1 Tax=Doryrhamphus excisus TaxID=161450 RepID=UPI0025AEC124|nr:CD48 antigen [Doryrhamphus excisus]
MMDQKVRIFVLVVFLCSLLCFCWAGDDIVYTSEGGTLRLQLGVPGPFTSVVWRFNTDLVAEWDLGSNIIYYKKFQNRATLNQNTGELHVANVTTQELEGKFTVDLNNTADAVTITAKIIDSVPDPVISSPEACYAPLGRCTLHCGGDSSKAEPVTFQWKHNQKETSRSIVIDINTQNVKTFSCTMRNPISVKESQPFKNPFYQNTIGPGGIAGLVLLSLGIVGGLLGLLFWSWKKKHTPVNVNGEPRPHGGSEAVPLGSNSEGTA